MSAQKQPSAVPQQRPIETITENGFSIVRLSDLNRRIPAELGKYCFVVRDPNDYELEITVEIDRRAVNEIIARSHNDISRDSSFWTVLAERHLADYLWENDDYPPEAILLVTQLSPEDCDLAARWKADGR